MLQQTKVSQQQIDTYVKGALKLIPDLQDWQLEAMVILHFDIPDKQATEMVRKSLEKRG